MRNVFVGIYMLVTFGMLVASPGFAGVPLGTAFTYQGQLKEAGLPVNGSVEFQFSLWDAATNGGQIGSTISATIPVSGGLFVTLLDFGPAAFDGQGRWIQVAVRNPPGAGSYTTLDSRQPISPTPYALRATMADGLKLPFAGTTGSGSDAVSITNSGSGKAGYFRTSLAGNPATTVYAEQNGLGRAGHFRIVNTTNTLASVSASTTGSGPALSGYTTGSGAAVSGQTIGGGQAGYFQINNQANDSHALEVVTNGTGGAAELTSTNPNGGASTLYVVQEGKGRAGNFAVNNSANVLQAVLASTAGSGSAIKGSTTGTGPAASFDVINPANNSEALKVANGGAGSAATFSTTNAANAKPALYAHTANDSQPAIQADGLLQLGKSTHDGRLSLYRNGSSANVVNLYPNSAGGNIDLYDNDGNRNVRINSDSDGVGAYLRLDRAANSAGFTVDGNMAGTGEPRVSISGSTRSAVFDMRPSAAANDSVALPSGSISASELMDEPGVAAASASSKTLNSLPTVIVSRTIAAPAAGYVLAIGSTSAQIVQEITGFSDVKCWVSESSSIIPDDNYSVIYLDPSMPSGNYYFPVTHQRIFSVGAGTHTFYFLGMKNLTGAEAHHTDFSLIYFSTAYGTMAKGAAVADESTVQGASKADPAAERTEITTADAVRLQRELSEVKNRLAALEAMLPQEVQRQAAAPAAFSAGAAPEPSGTEADPGPS